MVRGEFGSVLEVTIESLFGVGFALLLFNIELDPLATKDFFLLALLLGV
jgi:hypothetical protein